MAHIRQFDHVGITVADIDSVTAFFADLGLEIEGRTFGRQSSADERDSASTAKRVGCRSQHWQSALN